MVVALFDKEVVVAVNQHLLSMDHPGLHHLLQKLIVQLRSLVNQPEFGQIAMLHPVIQHPLHQKYHNEPIHGDYAKREVQAEEPDYRYSDGVGDFAAQVQNREEVVDYSEVHVLQLVDFGLGDALAVLRVQMESLLYKPLSNRTLYLYGQLLKDPAHVRPEYHPQYLQHSKFLCNFAGGALAVALPHGLHELLYYLREQQVERGVDHRQQDAYRDLPAVAQQYVFEELVAVVMVVVVARDGTEHFEGRTREGQFLAFFGIWFGQGQLDEIGESVEIEVSQVAAHKELAFVWRAPFFHRYILIKPKASSSNIYNDI